MANRDDDRPAPARPTTIRLDEDNQRIIDELKERLGISQSNVIRQALRLLARREGVKLRAS